MPHANKGGLRVGWASGTVSLVLHSSSRLILSLSLARYGLKLNFPFKFYWCHSRVNAYLFKRSVSEIICQLPLVCGAKGLRSANLIEASGAQEMVSRTLIDPADSLRLVTSSSTTRKIYVSAQWYQANEAVANVVIRKWLTWRSKRCFLILVWNGSGLYL